MLNHIFSFLSGVVAVGFLTGCSTIQNCHSQKEPMMTAYMMGDNAKALAVIENKLKNHSLGSSSVVNTGDEVVWRLEAGSLNFNLGNYQTAVDELKMAERLIEEYDDRALISLRDLSSEAATAVTNLNALPYRGLCRDRIALSIFKALAYLGLDLGTLSESHC